MSSDVTLVSMIDLSFFAVEYCGTSPKSGVYGVSQINGGVTFQSLLLMTWMMLADLTV